MGVLKVFSETGIPHSACLLAGNSGKRLWLGYQPGTKVGKDVWEGWIDRRNRSQYINYWVEFRIRDDVLADAANSVIADYSTETDIYVFGVRDCVSFVRDLAGYCGLSTGVFEHGNWLPYRLVLWLYKDNKPKVIDHNLGLGADAADSYLSAKRTVTDLFD